MNITINRLNTRQGVQVSLFNFPTATENVSHGFCQENHGHQALLTIYKKEFCLSTKRNGWQADRAHRPEEMPVSAVCGLSLGCCVEKVVPQIFPVVMRPFIIALINGNQELVGLQCAVERMDVRLYSNWHSFLLSIGAFFSPPFALSLPHV